MSFSLILLLFSKFDFSIFFFLIPMNFKFVTEVGIDDNFILSQSLNANLPIDLNEDGIFIVFNEVHLKKANSPIDITEKGILIFFNNVHP